MKRLASLCFVVGTAVLAAPSLTGCYAETSGYVEEEAPPAPREEVVVARPGYVWIHGHHHYSNGRYEWRGGYYERERPGYSYVEGRWEKHGKKHVWIEGRWEHRG
jgi:hypothetical protein